jgi:hypothetical protein
MEGEGDKSLTLVSSGVVSIIAKRPGQHSLVVTIIHSFQRL